MIVGVLIDLDGVLRWWDPAIMSHAEQEYGLAPGSLARAAFAHDLLFPAITGATTDEEWRAAVVARLARDYGTPAARAAVDAWSTPRGIVNEDVRDLVRQVRRQVRVGLLTNATSRLATDLAALGIAEEFDVVVNSARIGMAKPDPRVFTTAAILLGTPLANTLFVDDTVANVVASRATEMQVHLYIDTATLAERLRSDGLIA